MYSPPLGEVFFMREEEVEIYKAQDLKIWKSDFFYCSTDTFIYRYTSQASAIMIFSALLKL